LAEQNPCVANRVCPQLFKDFGQNAVLAPENEGVVRASLDSSIRDRLRKANPEIIAFLIFRQSRPAAMPTGNDRIRESFGESHGAGHGV
jgi:hypothetical protein